MTNATVTTANNNSLIAQTSKEVFAEVKLAAQSSLLLTAETLIVSAKLLNLPASTGLQVMGVAHASVTYLQAKVDERPLADGLADLLN
jgi:hypothetical protein